VPELRLELAPEPERAEVSREGFEQVPFELEPDLELELERERELVQVASEPDLGA
jgi:hypothetical protein